MRIIDSLLRIVLVPCIIAPVSYSHYISYVVLYSFDNYSQQDSTFTRGVSDTTTININTANANSHSNIIRK